MSLFTNTLQTKQDHIRQAYWMSEKNCCQHVYEVGAWCRVKQSNSWIVGIKQSALALYNWIICFILLEHYKKSVCKSPMNSATEYSCQLRSQVWLIFTIEYYSFLSDFLLSDYPFFLFSTSRNLCFTNLAGFLCTVCMFCILLPSYLNPVITPLIAL